MYVQRLGHKNHVTFSTPILYGIVNDNRHLAHGRGTIEVHIKLSIPQHLYT